MELSERQRELADAALRLIARGGLSAVSFRAVAAEAGWSLGAVQKAFSSKVLLVSAAFSRLRERSAPLPPGEPGRPNLRAWIVDLFMGVLPLDADRRAAQLQADAFGQWALAEPAAAQAIAESDDEIRGLLASLIERARKEGEIAEHIDAPNAAWAILVLANGTAQQLLYTAMPESEVRTRLDTAVGALLS